MGDVERTSPSSSAGPVVPIPGYMVWAAILYAGSASLLSYWVGRSLIRRNAERYAREADLRFSLVRVNEHIDAISLAGGEADEARRIELQSRSGAGRHAAVWSRGLTNLTWVTAGYGWLTHRGADPRCGAALLQRPPLLRRAS